MNTENLNISYKDVKFYRKSWVNTIFIFAGLSFITCILVLTGDIYYNSYNKDGSIKTWSPANKVAAVIMLAITAYLYSMVI